MGDIINDTNKKEVYYDLQVKYNDEVKKIENALKKYITEKFPEPDYVVFNDGEDDWSETSVFSTLSNKNEKERKQYLMYATDTDPKTNTTTFELIIYGASAQKIANKK